MEHPEILPLLVVIIGVLLSSLKKRKQDTGESVPPPIPSQPQRIPDVATIPLPTAKTNRHKSAKKQKKSRPSASIPLVPPPLSGQEEGTRSIKNVTPDAAYAIPADAPSNVEEWRKAIIAHEILKRKF